MNRRNFIAAVALFCCSGTACASTLKNKTFKFKIKTKSGGIIGNIRIQAKDVFAAISKVKKRYPGCEILEAEEV